MRENEGGVSEAIGYIIIFGLVMTGIGLVTLYGYPVLMQQESSANIRNMEQTMIVLQNDIKSLTYKLVPYKETTLRVSGGTLMLVNQTSMDQFFNITYNDDTVGPDPFKPGELRFIAQKENAVISLENGAVIKREIGSTGSFMLAQPRWYVDTYTGSDTLMINYIQLGSRMEQPFLSQTGVGTVRMRHFQTMYWNPPSVNNGIVEITYSPSIVDNGAYDYSQAWRNFLTDSNGLAMTETAPNSNIYRRTDIDNVVIKVYDLIVEEL
jgi:hypothetical protein